MLSTRILSFYKKLSPDIIFPAGIELMNPFNDAYPWELTTAFYNKYYNDSRKRLLVFGINPGRHGGGITGIPFTDPIRLNQVCGIHNSLKKKPELSSQFIYEMIDGFGGASEFFRNFLLTAICPLGFTSNGKNINYYDDKKLLETSYPFIIKSIKYQQELFSGSGTCFCLGEGTNFKIFTRLNNEFGFFDKIVPLPHPRWVMQYRRKSKQAFIELYLRKFAEVV